MEDRGDVIVVGAGPVGFLTALGLARKGIRVTLLEAEAGINNSPRAAIYFPTTLELIDKLGLLEDAEAIGLASTRFAMRFLDDGEIIRSDLRNTLPPGSKYDHNLHFGQHILAKLVSDHLARLPNAQVLWSHKVVALSQDGRGVTLTVATPDGTRELHADWVVGSDGARSSVRTLLGLPFEGHTWPDRFVATNVAYDFEKYDFELANMIADPVNWAVVARLGRENLWRVTYGEDAELAEDEIYARIPAHYAAVFPGKEPYRIVAWSPYRVQERCAPAFRVGRTLLAGDAAHALQSMRRPRPHHRRDRRRLRRRRPVRSHRGPRRRGCARLLCPGAQAGFQRGDLAARHQFQAHAVRKGPGEARGGPGGIPRQRAAGRQFGDLDFPEQADLRQPDAGMRP